MDLLDVTGVPQNLRLYGGVSCKKIGITLDGVNYLLKLPGNLKGRVLHNVALSYSNSPVCEYLGTEIFRMLGIPAHKVLLGKRGEKIVALCKDFVHSDERLYEFREIKSTFEPAFIDEFGNETDGMGSSLEEALLVIHEHPVLKRVPDAEHFFWQMFIVDAFIGNPDRNNGNWGILIKNDKEIRLAPVYDNGNCLNDKWDDEKLSKFMDDRQLLLNEAYKGKVCFFTNRKNKKINPFQYIESGKNCECNNALNDIVKSINREWHSICALIDGIDVISDVRKEFCRKILKIRKEKLEEIVNKFELLS
ncbi:CtkA family protein [bacterium D16-51]|nr:CtkA family protein [bacterium D16-59]RKI62886.1 CtkA family protein [bacterium D16-51]